MEEKCVLCVFDHPLSSDWQRCQSLRIKVLTTLHFFIVVILGDLWQNVEHWEAPRSSQKQRTLLQRWSEDVSLRRDVSECLVLVPWPLRLHQLSRDEQVAHKRGTGSLVGGGHLYSRCEDETVSTVFSFYCFKAEVNPPPCSLSVRPLHPSNGAAAVHAVLRRRGGVRPAFPAAPPGPVQESGGAAAAERWGRRGFQLRRWYAVGLEENIHVILN